MTTGRYDLENPWTETPFSGGSVKLTKITRPPFSRERFGSWCMSKILFKESPQVPDIAYHTNTNPKLEVSLGVTARIFNRSTRKAVAGDLRLWSRHCLHREHFFLCSVLAGSTSENFITVICLHACLRDNRLLITNTFSLFPCSIGQGSTWHRL